MSRDDDKKQPPEWTPARVLCHVAHRDPSAIPADVRRELLEIADDLERWTRRLREIAGRREADA